MVTVLLILCLLIWLPVLFFQINQRGFLVLVIWLFIAPVATNVINTPDVNPFYENQVSDVKARWVPAGVWYREAPTTITWQDLLEPTRTLLGLFLVVYLLGAVLQKKRLLPLDRTEIWMGAFSLIVVASVLLRSWRLAVGLHVAADAFIVPFLAYYIFRRLLTTEDHLRQLTRVIGYMGSYLIVLCLIERLTHQGVTYRLGGPFKDPNILPVVVAVAFFMVLLDSLRKEGGPKERQALPRGIQTFVLYLAPVIIILTFGRGNWVGFLLGVGVFLFLGSRLVNPWRKLRAVGLVLMLVPMAVISVASFVPKEITAGRIGNVGNVYGRLATWKAVIKQSGKAPIFGHGLNNTPLLLSESKERFGKYESWDSPHNSFLSMWIELGIVGLIAYLAIVGSIIQMGLSLYRTGPHSQARWRGVMVIAIMGAYLGPGLFANTLSATGLSHVYVYIFMGAIAGLHGRRRSVRDPYAFAGHRQQISTDMPAVTR